MKKLTITALLVLGSFTIQAQDVDYRVTGGVNFAYIEERPPLTDAASSLGFMLGVAANVGEHLFLQPSIQYASYGSTVTLPSVTGDTKHAMRLGFIRVPVQAGLRLFEAESSSPINLEARAGISESFLIGFSDKVQGGSGSELTRDDIAGIRTAGVVGAGVRLLFFSLDIEYEFGLTDIFENSPSTKLDALYLIFGGNF